MTRAPRVQFNVYLDPELLAGLKALYERDGLPMSQAVRRYIREGLERDGVLRKRPLRKRR